MARRRYGNGTLHALRENGGVVWQARWRDADGRRRQQVLSADRRIAERALVEIARNRDLELAGLKSQDGLELTLDEIRGKYLADLITTVKPWTYDRSRRVLDALRSFLGNVRLRDLRRGRLLEYRQLRTKEGRANRTINMEIGTLHAMCNWALQAELIGRNPVAGLKRLPVGRAYEKRPRRALSRDELAAFLAAAEALDDERQALHAAQRSIANGTKGKPWESKTRHLFLPQAPFVRALAFTGARFNELAQATWGDWDRGSRTLTLRATTTKSKKERNVPLHTAVERDLVRLLSIHSVGYGRSPEPNEPIFLTPEGYRLDGNRDNARRFFRDALTRAGIDRRDAGRGALCLHSLRHTLATLLAQAHAGLVQAQAILGHSTPDLTARIYTHLEQADLRAAVDKLERA